MPPFNPAAQRLREALGLVQGNPAAVTAIEAEDRARADAAEREAKQTSDRRASVAKGMEERAAALAADYQAVELAAISAAAETLAREQLEAANGLIPLEALALRGFAPRLTPARVDQARKRVMAELPVSWDRSGLPAAALASQWQTEAATAMHPPKPVVVSDTDTLLAERRAKLEADRTRRIEARKAAARAAGAMPPVAGS